MQRINNLAGELTLLLHQLCICRYNAEFRAVLCLGDIRRG